MAFPGSYNRSKPSPSGRPHLPRLLLVNMLAESRAPELDSLHSIISGRLNHDFRMPREKRRRTKGFRCAKNRQRKRPRLIDGAERDGNDGAQNGIRPSRRVRRRVQLRGNPAFGFCVSEDGTKRLRTHLWHAKRFSMGKQWGFYLPLGLQGRGKGSRAVLKRLKSGALVHDSSYSHLVQLDGSEGSILNIMKMVLRPFPSGSSKQMPKHVVYGACYAKSMLYDVRFPLPKFVAPVIYMWMPLKRRENCMDYEQPDGQSSCSESDCSTSARRLWIWLHPASYSEGLIALKSACEKETTDTAASMSCLSLEGHIGRLEVIGAMSLKILQKVLIPTPEPLKSLSSSASLTSCSKSRPRSYFILEHADRLPSQAIFSLEVQDPRVLHVDDTFLLPKTTSIVNHSAQHQDLVEDSSQHQGLVEDSSEKFSEESTINNDLLLSFWSKSDADEVFLSDCKQLWDSCINLNPPLPENIICRERQCKRLKDFYLEPANYGESGSEAGEAYDRSCPIILLRHADQGAFNSGWSVILPLSWVKPFWMALVSNGARAIGLRELHWIACNCGLPSFPHDFPDSEAYTALVAAETAKADEAARLRPPATRPINVPFASQWHCVAQSINRVFKFDESCCTEPSSSEFSILRTSVELNYLLEKTGGEGNLGQVGGLFFVRVLIHAFKEGSFEEAAVVYAPEPSDIPAWTSRSERHAPLQMPDSFIKLCFTREESGKWELQVPQNPSTMPWYRWPIGFISTGFVRGSSRPVAVAFCEARILRRLKEQQERMVGSATPQIFVLVRNLKSSTYRRATATISLDLRDEDLDFM